MAGRKTPRQRLIQIFGEAGSVSSGGVFFEKNEKRRRKDTVYRDVQHLFGGWCGNKIKESLTLSFHCRRVPKTQVQEVNESATNKVLDKTAVK